MESEHAHFDYIDFLPQPKDYSLSYLDIIHLL